MDSPQTATTYSLRPTVPRATRCRRKRWVLVLAALTALYVGSYALLSRAGGYQQFASGELRYFPPGFAIDDEFAWGASRTA